MRCVSHDSESVEESSWIRRPSKNLKVRRRRVANSLLVGISFMAILRRVDGQSTTTGAGTTAATGTTAAGGTTGTSAAAGATGATGNTGVVATGTSAFTGTTSETSSTTTTTVFYDPFEEVCKHEKYENVAEETKFYEDFATNPIDIRSNVTHRYFYRNNNIPTLNRANQYRKLIISLESCRGIVYIFVRKTRRCYPDPYSCISLTPGNEFRRPAECAWTHFMSTIDGSRDGTPTWFEIPFTTTQYYISVFSADNSQYTLTVLADTGGFPRPGELGRLGGYQHGELSVSIGWYQATYSPTATDVGTVHYKVYSAPLLDTDNRSSSFSFLRPQKTLNTHCGLLRNTDAEVMSEQPWHIFSPTMCDSATGYCNVTINWVQPDRRYVFNVVAVSSKGHKYAYAGVIMRTHYDVVTQIASDKQVKVVGIIAGSALGLTIVMYFMMLKMYA